MICRLLGTGTLCTQLKNKVCLGKRVEIFVWWTTGQRKRHFYKYAFSFCVGMTKKKEVRVWRWLGLRLSQNKSEKMRFWLQLVFHHHYFCHFCLFIWWGCKVARYETVQGRGRNWNMYDTFGGRHDVGKMYDSRKGKNA